MVVIGRASTSLFDASGKYPNGLLQATTSDPGAFDECIETVLHDPVSGHETLRAQYCNLRLRLTKDPELTRELVSSFRIGHPRLAEFKDYFTDEMLSGVRIVKPPGMNIEINNCVTSLPVPLSSGQKGIMVENHSFLSDALPALPLQSLSLSKAPISGSERVPYRFKCHFPTVCSLRIVGILTTYLIAFSAAANSGLITRKTNSKSDAYALRFLHGIRFLSLIWIMLGHSYGTISDTLSGLANNVAYFERWENMIVTGGYLSVDTFFFLSRHRWILGVFIFLSILGCSLATWQVAGTHMNPFMVAMTETVPMLEDTLDNYYVMPFYHAVAYFSGLIRNGYSAAQVTLFFSALVWCFSLSYLLFIACEAPVGRIDKLLFSHHSLKPDVAKIASGNSSNSAAATCVIPHKGTDLVCCDSGPLQGEASEKNKVFIIINGDTVCYRL
ncbi:hypothetical protein HPB52_006939 [Rhipicephalus sanguineus]|uniref:Nose resistant-to-fluoxetine protein N-terminal domain-containing protein n=1 Tax=Rhipicephalus sanguineus TaxID=34632 RepID=A0A9D4T7U2_RHISA|nr:hypothetical protein HPB52_006939 [Rhipicephalus sanguineus]